MNYHGLKVAVLEDETVDINNSHIILVICCLLQGKGASPTLLKNLKYFGGEYIT